MTRRALLLLPAAAPAARASDPDRMAEAWERFAEAGNTWAKRMMEVSPYSPDFMTQAAELFHKLQLGELFRKFEQTL